MKNSENFGIFINVVLLFITTQNISASNPQSHKKCHLQDSNCLTKEAQMTLKAFIQGIPGIKSFDKLHIDYVEVRQNKLHYIMRNTDVEGFNTTIIDNVCINTDLQVMRILFHSNLIANFDYQCDGEVYRFAITGNGKGLITMNNLLVDLVMAFDIIKNKQGKDIMDLKSFFYGADAIDGVQYHFGNLFNGDKVMSDLAHAFMNKTWRTLVANYGRFFTVKIIEEIFQAIKIYLSSRPLEDLALLY